MTLQRLIASIRGKAFYDYTPLATGRDDGGQDSSYLNSPPRRSPTKLALASLALATAVYMRVGQSRSNSYGDASPPPLTHLWGQYSPAFAVPSELSPAVPSHCKLTFAQVLSRHGARNPIASKAQAYNETIHRIQQSVTSYSADFEFLRNFSYTLGADELTSFGENQMIESGRHFFQRYRSLVLQEDPFIRATSQHRVAMSSFNWTQGFFEDRIPLEELSSRIENILLIPEGPGLNNTLGHDLCPNLKGGKYGDIGDHAQMVWRDIFAVPILERLQANLPGADLTLQDVIYLMDLCPFVSVADSRLKLAPFCSLFTLDEWISYDYYQTLGKFYGFSIGNPIASTAGVGFVTELISRLTGKPVTDNTSTNHTLNSSPETFPLDRRVYADFSHDNEMLTIYSALNLFNATQPLNATQRQSPMDSGGFAASWIAPFASRMYVEKMQCRSVSEELVRILINDRVYPLQNCGADTYGRCTLSAFVDSLGFARQGGRWDDCYVS